MSPDNGPLPATEVARLRKVYREHFKPLGEPCRCGDDNCRVGPEARDQLWAAGLSTEES